MCTAVTFNTHGHYFGRNLDLAYTYDESVTVMPRAYPLHFRRAGTMNRHYAMIGMAYVQDGYPLYYDATNEAGLSMAGLNFPDNAVYGEDMPEQESVAPFELIPWILGQCKTLLQARELLLRTRVAEIRFREDMPVTPLHWLIADPTGALTVECTHEGMQAHENPVGVLTNNPPFPYHMHNLSRHMGVSSCPPVNRFSEKLDLRACSLGMGGIGLPGDYSSESRFVRAAFVKYNSTCPEGESESVSQFFHILDAAAMPRGSVLTESGVPEITQYSSCCNMDSGVYYYKTYANSCLSAVDMHRENLEGSMLAAYPLIKAGQIRLQNS